MRIADLNSEFRIPRLPKNLFGGQAKSAIESGGIQHHQKFGLLIAQIAKFMGDA